MRYAEGCGRGRIAVVIGRGCRGKEEWYAMFLGETACRCDGRQLILDGDAEI